jgi:hypothetical protein
MDISIIILAGIAVALAVLIGAAIAIYVSAKEEAIPTKTAAVVKPTTRSTGYVAPELAKRPTVKHKGTPQHVLDNANRTHSFTRQRSSDVDYDTTPIIASSFANSVYIDSSPVYDTPATRSYDSCGSSDYSSSSSSSSSDSSSCSSSSSSSDY